MTNNNKLYIEVPIVGEQQVSLYNESREIYELFEDDILRLKSIMQLGVLHYFSEKLFKYTRYDHVLTMILLINRLERFEKLEKTEQKTTKRRLSTGVKLNGVKFSSVSELLKSWTLLYPIGHFQMTFASSHAFLRWIKSKESRESKFLNLVREQIEKSKLFREEELEVKEGLYSQLTKIITQERIMQVHKIFTFLKILKKVEELPGDHPLIPKLRELTKLMIFRKDYPKYEGLERAKKPEHVEKINDIVNYFLVLRELSFTILDGYVAQLPIQLNYRAVLDTLHLFIENEYYKEAIDDVEKFYTKTLYQSAEGAYYHLKGVEVIEKDVFSKYTSVEDLIDVILSRGEEKTKTKLDEKIIPAIESKSQKILEDKHSGKISDIISSSIGFVLDSHYLSKPVSKELEYFRRIPGVILYNMASEEYQIFVYPTQVQAKFFEKINNLVKVAELLYNKARCEHEDFEKIVSESSKLATYLLKEIFGNEIFVSKVKLNAKHSAEEDDGVGFTLLLPCIINSECLNKLDSITIKEGEYTRGEEAEIKHMSELLKEYISKNSFDWYLIAWRSKIKNSTPISIVKKLEKNFGFIFNVVCDNFIEDEEFLKRFTSEMSLKEEEIKALKRVEFKFNLKPKTLEETDLDVLIIGFSSDSLMISISEIKVPSQQYSTNQRKKHKEIIQRLKTKFKSYELNNPKSRDVETWILEIPIT